MKKSILLGCVAGVGLLGMSVVSYGNVVVPETTTVTEQDFEKIIEIFFDADDVKIEKKGENFDATITLIDDEKPENTTIQTVTFIPDGTFGEYAQYQVDLSVRDALKEILDELNGKVTISLYQDMAKVIPEKQFVSNRNLKIKDLSVNIQQEQGIDTPLANIRQGGVSFADIALNLSSQPVLGEKTDIASSLDISSFKIFADNIILNIPKITTNMMAKKAPMTVDELQQIFGAEEVVSALSIPTITISSGGDNALPMLMAKLAGEYTYGDGKMDFSYAITDIQTVFPFPPQFIPESVEVNVSLTDLNQDVLSHISQDMSEEKSKIVFDELIKTTNVNINKIEVKNKLAGILFQGRRQLDKNDILAFDGTLTITNLDVLSPEPKVDEQACNKAKVDLAQNPQDEFYQRIAEVECTPRGGVLDFVREYLKPENRFIQDDGTTKDIIHIRIKDNQVFLNDKKVYEFGDFVARQQANEILQAANMTAVIAMVETRKAEYYTDLKPDKKIEGVSKIEADTTGNTIIYLEAGQAALIEEMKKIAEERITCSDNVCKLKV